MGAIEKQSSAFIETVVDDEVVIVSLEKGHFFSLRDTGLAVWRKIDGSRDRARILSELENEFDASPEILAQDVDAFLDQLAKAGFISGHSRDL